MNADKLAHLDQHIERLRKQLEAAQSVRTILNDSPELADILTATLATGEEGGDSVAATNGKQRSPGRPANREGRGGEVARDHYEKIVAFFVKVKNKPSTTKEIADSTGLDRGKIVHIVYRNFSDHFEKSALENNRLVKQWRLKEVVLRAVGGTSENKG